MKTAYLGLGSNLGNRAGLLAEALRRLGGNGVEIVRVSSVYETAPVGLTNQPDFLNLVAEIRTALPPRELLARCLAVENALGRVRVERWGARTIDVDFLWQEGERLDSAELTLPHPRMSERGFVMAPLAELAPQLRVGAETASELAARLGGAGVKKLGALATLQPAP
ncbi:2-amino-4-hydroxy-6-hydroxymethyldihydropteridine diphosphokinase [Opitutaceae bacterium EW11]|nr:2-amino-4-hydroxy-6-hydroxymethyldihydropteridine diphosphokinase [Opitutaceae bacterium EW11]